MARPKFGEVHHSPLMGGAMSPLGKRFELNFLTEGAWLEAHTRGWVSGVWGTMDARFRSVGLIYRPEE